MEQNRHVVATFKCEELLFAPDYVRSVLCEWHEVSWYVIERSSEAEISKLQLHRDPFSLHSGLILSFPP